MGTRWTLSSWFCIEFLLAPLILWNVIVHWWWWGRGKLWRRQRNYVLILSNLLSSATYFRCLRSNGDQMNTQLLILHWIPISTPPSMECNSAYTIYPRVDVPSGGHTLRWRNTQIVDMFQLLSIKLAGPPPASGHSRMSPDAPSHAGF